MSKVIIRSFTSKDRQAVRTICADTADMGEPVENFFPHRESITDLLCGYYTDYEPESIVVAEVEGKVVGYVLGSLDNRRYGLCMLWIIIPIVLCKAMVRGVFFQQPFWDQVGVMFRNWQRLLNWRKESFHSHQAHMHIGIAKEFRQQHIGCQLTQRFLDYAKNNGVHEVTASVHDGNEGAKQFFLRNHFQVKAEYPMVAYHHNEFHPYRSLLYAIHI